MDQDPLRQVEVAKTRFSDKVNELVSSYRQKVKLVTKSLEEKKIAELKSKLNS